jgi:hypothetical protein
MTKKIATENPASHSRAFFIFLCWVLLGTSLVLFFIRLSRVVETSYDFLQDYNAAQHLLARNSIYSDPGAENNHPPFNAVLFVPLALLDYKPAILAWSLVSIFFYFSSGWMVLKTLQIRLKPEWAAVLAAGGLAWYPFQGHIALGQLSLLITICIIGAWACLKNKQEVKAGALIGMAALIKLFPFLLIGFLILSQRWKAAVTTILVSLGGFVLTWALVGREDFLAYFLQVAPKNGREYATFPINASLSAAAGRIFLEGHWVTPMINSPALAAIAYLGSAGLVLIFTAFFILRAGGKKQGMDYGLAMTCVAMLLVSPITWAHSFTILLLPFGLLLGSTLTRPQRLARYLFLTAVVLTLLPTVDSGFALVKAFEPGKIPWPAGLLLLYPTLALILTGVALAVDFFTREKNSAS